MNIRDLVLRTPQEDLQGITKVKLFSNKQKKKGKSLDLYPFFALFKKRKDLFCCNYVNFNQCTFRKCCNLICNTGRIRLLEVHCVYLVQSGEICQI